MIPKECKRLAEVDFPIAKVSRDSAREKTIRHGHPSSLHLWWARRPLAACRSILLALLLPDPCDDSCPADFKNRARSILPRVQGRVGASDLELREELIRFVGDAGEWENAFKPAYLEASRGLLRAAHGDDQPLVVDPFSGGGAIPLEALRLSCDVFASDLNPVSALILKGTLEDIPKAGESLPSQLEQVGDKLQRALRVRVAEFYPTDPDGAQPLTFIWARTITCDSCGAEVPLVRSFWLCKKNKRRKAIRYSVSKTKGKVSELRFEIFEPRNESDVQNGTMRRGKAVCLCCNVVIPPERVRTQLRELLGGANVNFDDNGNRLSGARLLAVAIVYPDSPGRSYRLAMPSDYAAVWNASKRLKTIQSQNPLAIPTEPLPAKGTLGFRVQPYGFTTWASLFTNRQLLALVELTSLIAKENDSPVKRLAAFAVSKLEELSCSICRWEPVAECPRTVFGRQAIPMSWDFSEAVPVGNQSGSFSVCVSNVVNAISASYQNGGSSSPQVADATKSPLPDSSAAIWFTDPPYYDAIPYSDLSDFFYVWLKRALPNEPLLRDHFDALTRLTPKSEEIVQDETKLIDGMPKNRSFFESRMSLAFKEGRRVLQDDGIGCVVFAHKTTEGWEALLSGMVAAGWVVTGSWPISTENTSRLRAQDSAALATSVHLVCRPRREDAAIGDWSEVLAELPKRVGDWMEHLQDEGVRGADLVFACIGPAMEIYSRYRRVEDAEGREIPLGGDPAASEPYKRGFLAYVWETVGRLALEQVLGTAEARARNGAAGALEEDSRLTALFLWTVQASESAANGDVASADDQETDEEEDEEAKPKKKSGLTLIYDVARRFAQPLGIHLDKWEGRIIATDKGVVRLMPVAERAVQLFGDVDASAISRRIEQDAKASRNYTLAFMQDVAAAPQIKTRGRRKAAVGRAVEDTPAVQTVTTLDRVHAAMLLQASGQANGLRAMLKEEQQRGPDFLRLANALSALYPKDSEEKRLLDAMLLAVPR